jgi:hypothetical protein
MRHKPKRGVARQKAGREYGGNAGLAFAMCEARKKRKNRQGGLKLFFVLIFCYFLIKQKVKGLRGQERNDTFVSYTHL